MRLFPRYMNIYGLLALVLAFGLSACQSSLMKPYGSAPPKTAQRHIVRVTITSQGYLLHRPWQQRRPVTHTAIGTVVEGGLVLVTGMLVADHRYIELETIDTQTKASAEVVVADYEANLALLKPLDPDFLSQHAPMPLAADVGPGDILTVWQVKPNGDLVPSSGQVTSVELEAFAQNNYFLAYRLNNSLQYRFNNLTLPVVQGDRLAGLVLRQNPKGQTIDVISLPVIRHFLEDARQGEYRGFPSAGFHYGPTQDPQLRRYIGMPVDLTGIYVQKVIKGGPADRAGLKAGDVITQMGEYNVSNTGRFAHPQYGKTSLVHVVRTLYHVGDELPVRVFRDGQILDLGIVLDHRRPEEFLVPPYIVDQAPAHLIVGGFVMQEISMSYLREYGNDWASRAPIHLLYYSQNQDYLNGDQREKIVIISNTIPTPYTIGYENLGNLEVLRVNGQNIGKLADVGRALSSPLNGFHKIEVKQHPKVIYLDPNQLPQIHQVIEERYRIPIPPLER